MSITSYRRKSDRSVELKLDDGTSQLFRNETDARAWADQAGLTWPEDAPAAEPEAPAPKKKKRK